MKFESGHTKTGGRKKGTPNRKCVGIIESCEAAGVDFFEELIKIAKDSNHPDHFAAIKEGCHYLYPKRKAVEVTNKYSEELIRKAEEIRNMSSEDLLKIVKEEISGIEQRKKSSGGRNEV